MIDEYLKKKRYAPRLAIRSTIKALFLSSVFSLFLSYGYFKSYKINQTIWVGKPPYVIPIYGQDALTNIWLLFGLSVVFFAVGVYLSIRYYFLIRNKELPEDPPEIYLPQYMMCPDCDKAYYNFECIDAKCPICKGEIYTIKECYANPELRARLPKEVKKAIIKSQFYISKSQKRIFIIAWTILLAVGTFFLISLAPTKIDTYITAAILAPLVPCIYLAGFFYVGTLVKKPKLANEQINRTKKTSVQN